MARALQERLRLDAPDIPTWLDRLELEGGVGWWGLIVVMTPAAMLSANTRREWRAARQRGVCVYPVKGCVDSSLDYASLPTWMQKAHFYDPDIEWHKLVAHLHRGCLATRVPFMAPVLSTTYVARPREMHALRQALLQDAEPSRLTALRGGGGYGKTTLAAAICHEDAVIEAFDDGILWVTLGQAPNLLNELIKLYAALTGERPGFVDTEDAARELALKLESKNCLIVLDDVWKTAHALPFLRGGAACARLITTRLTDVVAEARRVPVEEMTPDEALGLLIARLGTVPADIRPFQGLVVRLGEWPLPIKLAGSVMRQRMERGDTELNALNHVARALDKRGIVAFDNRDSGERSDAVGRTIEVSLEMLSVQERQRYTELAVFAEDEAIPITVAATLWQLDDIDSEDLAHRLDDFALVEFDLRHGTLHLHDVLRGFLAARLVDAAAVHSRLLETWGNPLELTQAYAWRAYAFHMRGAGRQVELQRQLLDLGWLESKLCATDVHALIADFDYAQATPVLALLRDALRLSAPALAMAPGQLRAQLVGRLLASDEPEAAAFVQSACERSQTPWLRPRQASLDAPGGMLLMTLVGHGGGVTALSADMACELLVSGSSDSTVRLWDWRDGRLIAAVALSRLGVRGLAVFAQGRFALIGSAHGQVDLLDLGTRERVAGLSVSDRSAITALAVSADGRIAVCASRDGKLRVWKVAERTLILTISAHAERVTSVAVSGDGTRAISSSDDATLQIWNLETAALQHTLAGHSADVNCVALTADGRFALSGSTDRTLILWDAAQGVRLRTLAGHAASVTAVAIAADGRRSVSGSSDGSAQLWDLTTGKTLAELNGHSDAVNAIVMDAAGSRAATGSADRSIKLWRLDRSALAPRIEAHAGDIVSLVLSQDGRLCASGGADGLILVRDLHSGRVVRKIAAHSGSVHSLAFTQDGIGVLSGGIDGKYRLWALDTGEGFSIPVRHLAPINDFAYSATVRYLTTSCQDHFVYVWDVPGGALISRYGTRRLFDHLITPAPRRGELPATDELLDTYLPGETIFDVVIVRMTNDGRHALLSATARDSGSLRTTRNTPDASAEQPKSAGSCLLVFEIGTGGVHSITSTQSGPIGAFAIDANGTRALWARSDHGLELWDLSLGERIALLEGHSDKVNAIAFGPQGDRAFSCGRDRTLRVWDLQSTSTLASFTADAALRSLAVAPDGSSVVVADVSGRVHSLQLEPPPATSASE